MALRRMPALAALLVVALSAGAAAAASSQVHPRSPGSAGASAWPVPVEETFNNCPAGGDGGDHALNLLKNRIDVSPAPQSVTVSSMVSLPWPQSVNRAPRATWSSSDAAAVARNEGRPVVAEGYFLLLRHEGTESPNCHDPNQRDYHTWLAGSATDSRAHALIAEFTPRVVARNRGWGGQSQILALQGQRVRIYGWLMLDQEHPEQLGATRGTLWEIHPITRVEVYRNGQWFDFNTGKVDSGKVLSTGSTGSSGGAAATATAAPTADSSSTAFSLRLTINPNPTRDGTDTTIIGTTSPGASCSVRVVYASGSASTSSKLALAQTAGADGTVSWTWAPSTSRPGPASATVKCTLGSKTATASAIFAIQ